MLQGIIMKINHVTPVGLKPKETIGLHQQNKSLSVCIYQHFLKQQKGRQAFDKIFICH
jgi:hypothetical protein